MRVTESRMIEMASEQAAAARGRAADASNVAASGMRVTKPSDDLVAWEEGERATISAAQSTQRGSAIESASDQLQATDGALSTIQNALTRVQELAVELSNATYSAADRASAANEVTQLQATVLATANSTGTDTGGHLLSGSQRAAPFTAAGVYVGDTRQLTVETSTSQSIAVGLPGASLTASNGVDVIGTISAVASALASNNVTALQASLATLATAADQLAQARGSLGGQMNALNDADDARKALEVQLASIHSQEVEADPITAASNLANAKNAYDTAVSVASVVQQVASGK